MISSKGRNVEGSALADTGAKGKFIDRNFARRTGIPQKRLPTPIICYNVDGTRNKSGLISNYCEVPLEIGGKTKTHKLYVTGLGNQSIILGYPWFQENNPIVNWRTGKITLKSTTQEIKDRFKTKVKTWIQNRNSKSSTTISFKATKSTQLALEKPKLDKPLKEQVPPQFHDFLDVFSEKASERLPSHKSWDHKIDLKPGFTPRRGKLYSLTPQEDKELREFLKENQTKGYIRRSESPMASSFFFVGKKDGKLRPCQDYRFLNEWTVKNAYPLPQIQDLLDKLKGAQWFAKFDVRKGYNNVRIREGDEWKGAFNTSYGLWEPLVMFFGMCNSPATFQSLMDNLFISEMEAGWLLIYMDDLLIFAKTKESLDQHIRTVLKKLRENDLFLKPEKCVFATQRVEYLGLIITPGHIAMDPVKIKGLRDWPIPTKVKEVRSFLGFGNFYRRFIKGYSQLAAPLNALTKKFRSFEWNPAADHAFNTMKTKFTEEPVLMMPDLSKPFQIETDASLVASGAVLSQLDINGARHPIAFISRTFSPAERNYDIYDRELLAIIRALEEWRHYIQGSSHETIILCDHQNLTYFRKTQRLNRRQARWSLFLSEFDIKLQHVSGSKLFQADTLSRRPDHFEGIEKDNDDITLLPDQLFINLIDQDLVDEIRKEDQWDQEAQDGWQYLREGRTTKPKEELMKWTADEQGDKPLLFYQGRQYIGTSQELRRKIISKFHDHSAAGHPGELETYNQIKEHFYWPGLRTFVRNYVKGCGQCQQFKINRHPIKPPLMGIEGPKTDRPFSQCSMDMITDLPPSKGFDSILSIVDHGLTKGVILIPCKKSISQEEVAGLLIDHLFRRFGLPDSIISDRGPQFASRAFKELLKILQIRSRLTTAYHPQSDGTTE